MRDGRITFINPYNFVPLVGKKHAEAEERENEELQSGVITYSLLTKTPLFIPDVGEEETDGEETDEEKTDEEKTDEEQHKCYEFFSYGTSGEDGELDVKPVIPGSEIREIGRAHV